MLRPSRSSLLTAAVSLAAGLLTLPAPAYAADTTTSLDATAMAAALRTVADASTAAARDGWKITDAFTGGSVSASSTVVVDVSHKIAHSRYQFGGDSIAMYVVGGKGMYRSLSEPDERAAVKMMGRPQVRYQFTAVPSVTLGDFLGAGLTTPATALTDVAHAGTRTVHGDGSAHYAYRDGDGMTITLHVSAAGTLTGSRGAGPGFSETATYGYGVQHVTLPAASVTISATTLARGVAYVNMTDTVGEVAAQGAADTRRAAHGHRIKVAVLRRMVRQEASDFNRMIGTKMVRVTTMDRGARVYAKNPWTHKTTSFTVKASGKKIAVEG
ncbi:hypothetical protein [Krasilnikovia sp. M28-CT-15]|uniref:hypothetical protein n=1 Tax=Krasilnikovia sp. M28-CT-15 TaxID=3373540 RepID=UPI003875FE25